MRTSPLLITLALGLGLALTLGLFALVGQAAPGNPILNPPRNSHTTPLTSSVSITYNEPISAATVTSRTFAVHAMQSGLVTATHSVSGGTIVVVPEMRFHQGELVYVIATTRTLSITGTEPASSSQWQFRAGQLVMRSFGRFRDIKASLFGVYASAAAWGDYDNDGDLDILLTGRDASSNPTFLLYRNDAGSFTFVSTSLMGVQYGSAAWGDYDKDGDLDILLAGWDPSFNGVSQVYRNDGGSFTDIGAGLTGVGDSSVAWGDYDNDGDLDILLTGYDGSSPLSLVYRNDAGSFTDIGAGLLGVCASSVSWGDYDSDGDLDILLVGWGVTSNGVSLIYRNDTGSFTDIGAGLMGVDNGSAAWGDYDNDGDLDIVLTGYNHSGPISRVYRNDGGSFTDIGAGLTGVGDSSVAWGDYDNDGDLDISVTGYDGSSPLSLVYRNDAGSFTDIEAALIGLYGALMAWGDYDNDGDLDLLLTGYNDSGPTSRIYSNEDYSSPDLAILKSVTPQVAAPGDAITYTLTFSSNAAGGGAIAVTDVVITDSVPVSVTSISVISSGVAITQTSPGYVWQVQDLAPGQSGAITITGVLSHPLSAGTFANTATIACAEVENDDANNSDSVNVTVRNVAPIAVDDSGITDEHTQVTISALDNDYDANGDPLFISAVGIPDYGSASISGTTQLVYTATNRTASYNAVFTYTVSDSNLTDTAVVTVTVSAENDAPTISDIADQTTRVGVPLGPIVFTVADEETPANALLLSAGSSNTALVPADNILFGGAGITRTVNITPTPGLVGMAIITVSVDDGMDTASDAFVVKVEGWQVYLPVVLRNH